MIDTKTILEVLEVLQDEFYGKEEEDFEGGVMEDNYECAEWARDNVDGIFNYITTLVAEVDRLKKGIDKACYDLTNENVEDIYVVDQIKMSLVELIKEDI